jgi:DNA-binding response OmpR family regulator
LRRHKKHQDHNAKSSPADPPNGLTSTENRLLFCLESGQGRLFSYSQLLTGVWGGKEVSLNTLHYYVRRLRGKIGGTIVQVRGIGYRFSGNGNGAVCYTGGGTKGEG